MFRNLIAVAVLVTASFGLVMAEPVKGRITSIEGKKVTIMVGAKKDVKGEAKTFDLGNDVKVMKAGKDGKSAIDAGLNAPQLKNIDAQKGVGAILEVTNGKVTEITIIGGKKKE